MTRTRDHRHRHASSTNASTACRRTGQARTNYGITECLRLGEVDGLQISLTGARQKLAQLDQIATKTTTSTELGIPSFPQIAGRSIPLPDTPT
jgi:hypothetical protein